MQIALGRLGLAEDFLVGPSVDGRMSHRIANNYTPTAFSCRAIAIAHRQSRVALLLHTSLTPLWPCSLTPEQGFDGERSCHFGLG